MYTTEHLLKQKLQLTSTRLKVDTDYKHNTILKRRDSKGPFLLLIYKRKTNFMTNGIGRVGWRNYVSPLPNPLWNGMLAYYTGDNTADDAKGTANGTLTNGATYGTGKINGGFSFDGINDTITLSNTVTKFSSSTPFTYNVWVKAVSRTGFIYMDANATTAGTAIGFYGGALAFAVGDVA